MQKERKVLGEYGSVVLDNYVGSDLDVVNAAKVSFARQAEEYGNDEERILRFLIREHHGTPFEHNYFKFHVRAPIVVFWEWVRHRIASYNVESGRYVELRPHFYIPEQAREQIGRPGNYTFRPAEMDKTFWLQTNLEEYSKKGFELYQRALAQDIAKEQARLFIPMNLFVEFYFSCNARSLMNFLKLRNDKNAMYEIRVYAEEIERLWAEKMPDTAKAFQEFDRVAP